MTVPDGTVFDPGVIFTKTWRIQNAGTCTWTTEYELVFMNGDTFGSPEAIPLPRNIAPEGILDLSVNLLSPPFSGAYRGDWYLRDAKGQLFGSGAEASDPLWADVRVSVTSLDGTAFNFYANACQASWVSGAGALPCPGANNDRRGYLLRLPSPRMEDGTTSSLPGLLTFPQNVTDGYIRGAYPAITVLPGDRFKATVGCENGAQACLVLMRLDYQIDDGPIFSFWRIGEVNDGKTFQADVDLSPFGYQEVKFILHVQAFGPATQDRAIWVAPRIVRLPPTPTPRATTTASPTPTATPTR